MRSKPGTSARDERVRLVFTADAPNQLWLTDLERHEALPNRAVVKGRRLSFVAADG